MSTTRPDKTTAEKVDEIHDRTRRIETRLTKCMEHLGFDTGVGRPEYRRGSVHIPSLSTSLQDILAAVPEAHPRDYNVGVMHKDKLVLTFKLP